MRILAILVFMALALSPCCSRPSALPPDPTIERPAGWAQPLEQPGLRNLFKVSGDLYRGAQPVDVGFVSLKGLGVRTVVDLRFAHTEADEARMAGLAYKRVSFNPLERPTDDEVLAFLRIVMDKANSPVFLHCLHGSDRTGTMCAVYRIFVQGWGKKEAVREMREGGYGFHAQYYGSYATYVENLDVEGMRRRLSD